MAQKPTLNPYNRQAALELVKLDPPFDSLIVAAMLRADTKNAERLKAAFPELYAQVVNWITDGTSPAV